MSIQIYSIPIPEDATMIETMNAFLQSHRIVNMTHHPAERNGVPYEVFVIAYEETKGHDGVQHTQATAKTPEVDYKEKLGETRFKVYLSLHRLRRQLANDNNLYAFKIMTNEQLAQLVEQQVTSLTAMASVNGIGRAKLEKYGKAFLEVLQTEIPRMQEELAREADIETQPLEEDENHEHTAEEQP